jgi:pimeloyl-ACP methyl ester carboxylesterase
VCMLNNEMNYIVSLHVLPNSGHWVHVDNPKRLLEIVTPRMASLST